MRHAIDEALAHDLGTTRRAARSMRRKKRVKVLPDLPTIGTAVRENRAELRCEFSFIVSNFSLRMS